MKKCISDARSDASYIEGLSERDLLDGLAHHSDPKWWLQAPAVYMNQAYLHRWGAYLRREARRRGLL